jgi:hypothetical protein
VSGTPGGWRGTGHEAHLYLDPHDDAIVRAAHARAADAGGTLDAKLKDLEAATASSGGKLEGLDYSVKRLDSLRRKVASDVGQGQDASAVVAGTRDMNRYTICFPAESYSDGVAAGFNRLQELGLTPYNPEKTHKNAWNDPSYKGINTSWQDQDTGQFVEVQFHTPESFKAKSDNHALYELSRSGSLDRREMAAADWLQAQRYENVEIPPGHDATVPAKPSRELKDFPPEALEQVRAKEAALKQSQAGEPPASEEPEPHPPRSADANDATQVEPVPNEREGVGEGPDTAEPEKDVAEPPEATPAAEDQGAAASYDDHENEQMARIAAVEESDSHPSQSEDANDVAPGESAQDAAGERPETGESEEVFPQPVDEGAIEPHEVEQQDPGEAGVEGQDTDQTDRSPDAEDAQGQDTGASYDDHEDKQMARIAAAADEQQESGDDYGDTSFTAENRERGGAGD